MSLSVPLTLHTLALSEVPICHKTLLRSWMDIQTIFNTVLLLYPIARKESQALHWNCNSVKHKNKFLSNINIKMNPCLFCLKIPLLRSSVMAFFSFFFFFSMHFESERCEWTQKLITLNWLLPICCNELLSYKLNYKVNIMSLMRFSLSQLPHCSKI